MTDFITLKLENIYLDGMQTRTVNISEIESFEAIASFNSEHRATVRISEEKYFSSLSTKRN